jgi:signal recognition particle GTPase
MTKEERGNPTIIGASRKKRIAVGSGVNVNDVSRLLKQFEEVTKHLSNFSKAAKLMDRVMPTTVAHRGRSLSADDRREIKKRRKMERLRKKQSRR